MNLPEHLRIETREIHEELHVIVDLKHLLADRAEYVAGLLRYQSAVEPVERWMRRIKGKVSAARLPDDLPERLCKAEWLKEDVKSLAQFVDSTKSDSADLPIFDLSEVEHHLISQVAGVLYVMEGMTLGGIQISRLLRDQLQVDAHSGGRFFAGYAEETRSRWNGLKQWLVKVGSEPDHSNQIASDAAKFVFNHFANSLRSPCQHSRDKST